MAARSAAFCGRGGETPSQASSGVRAQKRPSAAVANRTSDSTLLTFGCPAKLPVTRGISNIPQAPCSRGTRKERRREELRV